MLTTETAEPLYTKNKRRPTPEHGAVPPNLNKRLAILNHTIVFLFVALFAFALAGLLHVKSYLQASIQSELLRYRWLVLVEGAQIDIDEVGRALERFPHVREVSFVSRESAFERLKRDESISDHLRGLSPAVLPAAWNVRWRTDFAIEKQDQFLTEARALPGVVEVAVNESVLNSLQRLREHLLGVRVVLAGFFLLLMLSVVAIGLRFLVSGVKFIKIKQQELGLDVLVCALGWAAGVLFASYLSGVFSATILPFGILVGLGCWAWKQLA